MKPYRTVDEYIAYFPKETQEKLQAIRKLFRIEVPDSEEKISYGIPTVTLDRKYLLYFAGYKNHISLYPVTATMENSLKEIGEYRTGKGTLQFPHDTPLPLSLIRKIIKVRVKEHAEL